MKGLNIIRARVTENQKRNNERMVIMDLTAEVKELIDNKSYTELLAGWRFTPAGDPMFQGESGKYWGERMAELRDKDPAGHVRASKTIGW